MTFMVELTPKLKHSFNGLAYDQHRTILTDLISENIVSNYAENESRNKFWVILDAYNEDEVIEILSDLPTLKNLHVNIIPLYTHQSNFNYEVVYSLN